MAESEGIESRRLGKRKALLRLFLVQMVSAALLSTGVLYGGYYLCDCIPTPDESADLEEKLVYFVRSCVFPCALILVWSIASVIYARFTRSAIPIISKDDLIQPQKNILMNTVEQGLLFLMICLVLATYLGGSELHILPVYSFLWVMGRILFTVGYTFHPKYRLLGTYLTFIPVVTFLGVIVYLMYSRGFMYGIRNTKNDSPGHESSEKFSKVEL